jgi:hypothetical protein
MRMIDPAEQTIALARATLEERSRIIKIINAQICSDHLENAKCLHSACYELDRMVDEIERAPLLKSSQQVVGMEGK